MAWPVDQSGLNRDSIYYRYHSADPSPFVPLPQLPNLSWGSPADGVHLWGCYPPDCLSCRAMPASAPSTWVALTGPNPTNPDPAAAIPSFHQEPQSKPQKKGNTKQTPGHILGAPLQCKWEGCRYSGYFNRKHELIRHLRKIHIDPLAHPCPVESCAKVCNRSDNLLQHMKNRHGLS